MPGIGHNHTAIHTVTISRRTAKRQHANPTRFWPAKSFSGRVPLPKTQTQRSQAWQANTPPPQNPRPLSSLTVRFSLFAGIATPSQSTLFPFRSLCCLRPSVASSSSSFDHFSNHPLFPLLFSLRVLSLPSDSSLPLPHFTCARLNILEPTISTFRLLSPPLPPSTSDPSPSLSLSRRI
jgi:hypothetical protein